MPITRERIKPAADVPLVVTLEDTNAPESHSQYTGLEYRYNVNVEGAAAFIYLPPAAHQQIQKSGAQIGDQIQIVKSLRGKQAFYSIQVLSDATEPQVAHPVSHLRGSYPSGSATNGQHGNAHSNGHGNGNGRVQTMPAPQGAPNQSHPMVELMTKCIVYGARANRQAYEELRQAGIEMDAPTWEDARATGSSFFIERNKQQRGGAA
ncbi:MAG: hypothetical protein ACRD4Q_10965 [Candidatus Acidiferrales bacterium]